MGNIKLLNLGDPERGYLRRSLQSGRLSRHVEDVDYANFAIILQKFYPLFYPDIFLVKGHHRSNLGLIYFQSFVDYRRRF
ncbi:unnamed protein product [Strongylus vulgaris]|uniref:Uncharacterized protein n=1 Tax=Strongylus vulgaris TaxID=40348 RepID=A0A3P7KQ87_STRVU|nr:unnamed protein product [Strongylus vulgaris]